MGRRSISFSLGGGRPGWLGDSHQALTVDSSETRPGAQGPQSQGPNLDEGGVWGGAMLTSRVGRVLGSRGVAGSAAGSFFVFLFLRSTLGGLPSFSSTRRPTLSPRHNF